MKFKPIKNDNDCERAEALLAKWICENQDGAKDDDIDVLSTLVEKYERDTVTIEAPTPVAAIRFRMDQMGLSPRDLEPFIGSRARVSEILSESRKLSVDMIRALHNGLDIPYESLLNKKPASSIKSNVRQPVLGKLNSNGFKVSLSNIDQFIALAFGDGCSLALRRKTRTPRANSKTDEVAQLLWQAAVLTKANSIQPNGKFKREQITPAFLRKIAQLSIYEDGPIQALDMLSDYGIIVVVVPQLPGTYLDGAVMLKAGGTPVIGLTLRHDKVDNFWFTLLHELSHIARHFDELLKDGFAFIDDLEIDTDDGKEEEADELARDSLIPQDMIELVQWDEFTGNADIMELADLAQVHVSIPAGRWQRDCQEYRRFARLIERNTIRDMLKDT